MSFDLSEKLSMVAEWYHFLSEHFKLKLFLILLGRGRVILILFFENDTIDISRQWPSNINFVF